MPRDLFRNALICLAAGSTGAVAQSKPAAVDEKGFAACFDAQTRLVPFSGVALAQRGEQSFLQARGFADADAKVPISRETPFRLASVQKVMTRAAIGLLAQQGKIDLDAPIGKYLPGLKADAAAITIDQLLQHKSGLAPFTNLTKLDRETRMAYARAANSRERAAVVLGQPPSFRPGAREEYSNGGYQVLGAIIETVSGKDYGAFLDDALFGPLGMTSSKLLPDQRTAVRLTKMRVGGGTFPDWTAAVARQERPGHPAGDGVSTADDMTRLGQALLGDALMSPAVKAQIFPRKGEVWRIGQSGGTMGTNTDFSAYPDQGWVVTVLSNYDPPAGELMGEVLRTFVLGKGCTPLSEKDRVSPMQRLKEPGPTPGT